MTGRVISARDGTRLFVQDQRPDAAQTGPTILCLSGVTRNSRDFARLADDLVTRGHRVVSLDYRGRGRSERAQDPASYTPVQYLDDIRHILTALNLHSVVVIGTSLGGFLAMGMAVAMPTVLAGVVLNDCGPELPAAGVARIVDYIGAPPSFSDWDQATEGIKLILPDLNLDEDEWRIAAEGCFTESGEGRIIADWDPRIAEPMRMAGPPPPLWPLFNALRAIPVLAIRGEISNLLSPECFGRMADAHPGLQQLTIANRGHAPTLDEPSSRSAIHDFLRPLP